MEKAHVAGKATEKEVLDGVLALGRSYMWMDEYDDCEACFKRAKEGFVRLLGADHVKSVDVTKNLLLQTTEDDNELIAEFRALWERAKVTLVDEAVTFDIANDLGDRLCKEGEYEEAKVFNLVTLEGKRRVLGEEHKKILDSLNNQGIVLDELKDYEGALAYYQQALKVQDKVRGKTHPDTLMRPSSTWWACSWTDRRTLQRQRRFTGLLWMFMRSRWGRIIRTQRAVR